MIQLDVRVRTPHAQKFVGGVGRVVGWWVADTNYLYPASWGWIKNTIKNKLWFANSPKCSLRQDNLIYIYIS